LVRCYAGTLQLLHGSDITGLDVVLELGDLLLELIERDLVVLNDQVDLELLDTVTNRDEGGSTPDETVLLDGTDASLELLHVGLIVPGLDVHGDNRLGSGLHLAGLLCGVLCEALLTDTGVLSILLLVVGTEEVNFVIVLLLSVGGGLGGVDGELSGLGAVGSELLGGVAGERGELGLERGDVLVPAGSVGVLGDLRGRLQGLEGLDIGLGGGVANNVRTGGGPALKD